jgi:hypothetical protein
MTSTEFDDNADQHKPEEARTPQPKPNAHRTPEQWSDLISERIEEAMRAGHFDNLRGKGKPLDPASEPHTPPEMQMANSLLKNNDLTPAWISDRNALLAEIENFRARLRREVSAWRAAGETAVTPEAQAVHELRWQAQLAAWQEEVRTLNRRIEGQNFKQPVSFLEIVKVRLTDELTRAAAG